MRRPEGQNGSPGPLPSWLPRLATRGRPGRAWRSDGGRVCFSLAGPYFEEPLQWKVTEDCQVLLTCKANPRPRLQPCPQAQQGETCGLSPSPVAVLAPLPHIPCPVLG